MHKNNLEVGSLNGFFVLGRTARMRDRKEVRLMA